MALDERLVQRVIARRAGADAAFVEACRPLVLGIARGRFGFDAERTEEVLQATILRLWEKEHRALRAWRRRGRFSTYLTVIVTRLCLQERARGRSPARHDSRVSEAEPEREPGPVERIVARQRGVALNRAVARLPPRDRLVLVLRYRDERRPAEIAALLGIAPGAARKALHDARRRLRRELARSAPELLPERGGNGLLPAASHSSGGKR